MKRKRSSQTKLMRSDYATLLAEVKERIRAAQYAALKAVNKELIALYLDIGRLIVERQQGETWGKSVVEKLAADLRSEFPGISGFSAPNLWRMKLFYETYAQQEKLSPMVREIGWTHNLIILEKCKDDLQREFYIRMTRKFGWTKNVLHHHIAVLDDRVRLSDENPSIGIILCKAKDRTIVEYALRETNKPIGVAAYRIVTTLPAELRGQLPSPEQITKLLEGVE